MTKYLTSDLRRNLIKIFCLATGLAIGMLLVAKVCFEQTYDSFLPEIDRLWLVTECARQDGELKIYEKTAGAIAPGLKEYVPQVEASARLVSLTGGTKVATPDGRKFAVGRILMVDSNFFDIIRRPVIEGNAGEALAVKWSCAIPASLAARMGENPIGARLTSIDTGDENAFTVGAVYEDFPANSTFDNAIYLSLNTLPAFFHDGRENWAGNDMYSSFVRLNPGTTPDDIAPHIRRMLEDHIEPEDLEMSGYGIGVRPLAGLYARQQSVRTMSWIMSVLALIILSSASLNYFLVVLAQMQWRAKDVAVRKCYGTSRRHIFAMVMAESLAFLLISSGVAAIIVASLSAECRQLLGVSAGELLGNGRFLLTMSAIALLILAITGALPAWLYSRTPVSEAFRRHPRGRRRWKLALLSVQFFATAFLFCLLTVVGRQYRMLDQSDVGYDYSDLAMASVSRLDGSERARLASELRRLGCVAGVSSAYQDFTRYAAGNNIYSPDNRFDEINVADFYGANPDVFDVAGMEFVQGGPFHASADTAGCRIVVDEAFIRELHKIQDFEGDNIVGRSTFITEHSQGRHSFEIAGVVRRLKRNGFVSENADARAVVFFPSSEPEENLYVRFHHMDGASLAEARALIDSLCEGREISLLTVKSKIDAHNSPVHRFGTSVMIAGVVIVIITLIGLTGYAADEVGRRAREIAIRKVNGMSVSAILGMLCRDILRVAVPTLLLGAMAAYAVGREWIAQFTERAQPSVPVLAGVVALLLVILVGIVVITSLPVTRSNPVRHMREE